MFEMMHRRNRHEEKKSPFMSISTGLVLACVFGAAWFFTHGWFFLFPLVFAGILPVLDGISRLGRWRRGGELDYKPARQSMEKQILLVAKQNKGRVTPALVALHVDAPLEKVEKTLSDMAKKGFVEMHVTANGRIEYLFHDFADIDETQGL
jgi:hypothetical protein